MSDNDIAACQEGALIYVYKMIVYHYDTIIALLLCVVFSIFDGTRKL
jgi:hypothetical protein